MTRSNRRAIVLGLDGATFDVLLPRVKRGQMPNLAALLEGGTWTGLHSTTPPFSAQAWVSMATGKSQGKHGVVDFWEHAPDHVRRSFVSARSVQAETLWHVANRQGLRVGVVNVPVTYPPSPVDGYLVSGFLTPQNSEDYVYPPEMKDEILSLVPDYNPDPFDPLGASKRQILELEGWMEKHERVARRLLDHHPVDLSFTVVQALDHLQHLFWSNIAAAPGGGEYAAPLDRCYGLADDIIGHRRQIMAGSANLFLVSDHGFGPAHKWFHVNRFLQERDLLVMGGIEGHGFASVLARMGLTPQTLRNLLRRVDVLGLRRWMGRMARVTLGRQLDESLALPVDWSRTQAVSGSPATEGIFVNLKGREPQGIVEPGAQYEALRERLAAELGDLFDPETGDQVIHATYRREDLYEGPFLDLLPDLVFDLGDGPYLASDAPPGGRETIEPLPGDYLQGKHHSTGIFVAAGPDIRQGAKIRDAKIVDVAPTVLYALDLPIPEDMDGRPLLEIFAPEYQESHPVRFAKAREHTRADEESIYDEEDAAEMERRLRGLGYVS